MSEQPVTMIEPAKDADWYAGYEDGIIGQTWLEHHRMLGFETEREHAVERGEIEKRIARARADHASAAQAAPGDRQPFRRIEQQLAGASADRDRYPHQYSPWIGAGFLVCALAIMGADFPLSRAIAEQILHRKAA